MKILSFNISHNGSVCYFENNNLKFFCQEDRYNLKKNWSPTVDDCNFISLSKNKYENPDIVCFASYDRSLNPIKNDEDIIKKILNNINLKNYFFDKSLHHIYHAISGFYFSKFEEAMCLVVDGAGSQPLSTFPTYQEMESIFYIDKKTVEKKFQHLSNRRFCKVDQKIGNYSNYVCEEKINNIFYKFSSNSVGGLEFNIACLRAGMRGIDAGKLMGLSSYAYTDDRYDVDYFKVEIAKRAQEKTFRDTCELIERSQRISNVKNIILSGGYFLNCVNNFEYVKKYPNLNFFVDPIPYDAGTAIGVSLYYENYKK